MLYLYTIMMLAWDLDKDTHAYFREYLKVFIDKRKISKNLRAFVLDTRSRAITSHIRPGIDLPDRNFNELRIGLPIRIYKYQKQVMRLQHCSPILIKDIHPPKYYTDP